MLFSRHGSPSKAGLLCVAVVLASGAISTALAVPSFKGPIGPFDIEAEFIGDCGGYAVLANVTVTGHFIEHYDKDGNLVRANVHLSYTESIYYGSYEADYSDPEVFLVGHGEGQNERYDLTGVPPVVAVSGGAYRVTAPGAGVVYIQTGNILFNLATGEIISQAGPSDNLDGNEAALCAALAP